MTSAPNDPKGPYPGSSGAPRPDETIDDILDAYSNDLDDLGKEAYQRALTRIAALRKIDERDCADDLQDRLHDAINLQQYGTGWSAYIKDKVIRPIQRKYRKQK